MVTVTILETPAIVNTLPADLALLASLAPALAALHRERREEAQTPDEDDGIRVDVDRWLTRDDDGADARWLYGRAI